MAKTKKAAVNKVLNVLRKALGTGEHPPGSNSNFIVDWYNENIDKIGDGPWCEMTDTWAMHKGGAKALKKGRAYTIYAAQDAQKGVNGSSWHWGTKGMQPGDQVYFDFAGKKGKIAFIDHTGTVEKRLGNGNWHILEGNTGKGVLARVERDEKFIVGYVRFDWNRILLHDPDPNEPEPDAIIDLDAQESGTIEPLEVDGKLGPLTIKRWQKVLKRPVTGKMGVGFIKAVQSRLKETVDRGLKVDGEGIAQDGERYKTVGALQRYLKSPVDQRISENRSQVVMSLQRRLNEGRF